MDPHQILGIAPDASHDEIRRAYTSLVRRFHPDRNAQESPAVREAALARMNAITTAYGILTDPRQRAHHERIERLRGEGRRPSPRASGDAATGAGADVDDGEVAEPGRFDYRRRASAEFTGGGTPAGGSTWTARPPPPRPTGPSSPRPGAPPRPPRRSSSSSSDRGWFDAVRRHWPVLAVLVLLFVAPRLLPGAATPTGTAPTGVAPPTTSAVVTGPVEATSAEAIARDIHRRTNDERTHRGAPPLTWHPGLAERALDWSFHMLETGVFEHSSPEFQHHPDFAGTGENILGNYLGSDDAHVGWMTSDGHRANILDADWDAVGIGVVCAPDGRVWATQIFGAYARRTTARPPVDLAPEPIVRRDRGITCAALGDR